MLFYLMASRIVGATHASPTLTPTLSQRAREAKGGFSLIELTAALFVLTIGLFGAIQMYHFGIAKIDTLNESAIATRAVQNEIETLRALPFPALKNTDDGRFVSETPALEKLVNATSAVAIRDYGSGMKGLKKVTVSLRWTGENGRRIEKKVTTLIAAKQ